ncbi:MAG: hypothetical protein QW728_07420 [Thermoplasmata archaeon]
MYFYDNITVYVKHSTDNLPLTNTSYKYFPGNRYTYTGRSDIFEISSFIGAVPDYDITVLNNTTEAGGGFRLKTHEEESFSILGFSFTTVTDSITVLEKEYFSKVRTETIITSQSPESGTSTTYVNTTYTPPLPELLFPLSVGNRYHVSTTERTEGKTYVNGSLRSSYNSTDSYTIYYQVLSSFTTEVLGRTEEVFCIHALRNDSDIATFILYSPSTGVVVKTTSQTPDRDNLAVYSITSVETVALVEFGEPQHTELHKGSPADISINLTNIGAKTVAPSTLTMYSGSLKIGDFSVPSLSPEQKQECTFRWTPQYGGRQPVSFVLSGGAQGSITRYWEVGPELPPAPKSNLENILLAGSILFFLAAVVFLIIIIRHRHRKRKEEMLKEIVQRTEEGEENGEEDGEREGETGSEEEVVKDLQTQTEVLSAETDDEQAEQRRD